MDSPALCLLELPRMARKNFHWDLGRLIGYQVLMPNYSHPLQYQSLYDPKWDLKGLALAINFTKSILFSEGVYF